MTSYRQIWANRRNALKSTGPKTRTGKQASRCNAVRHGLTAETVIGALEDAEDYKAFEAVVTADYDAQSAVERELVLRLASILWRLRRAMTMETGLFEIQAQHLADHRQSRQLLLDSRGVIHAVLRSEATGSHIASHRAVSTLETAPDSAKKTNAHSIEFARCFLRLANLPSFVLDRLSRYEATLWRQAARILFALDALDRRKPHERRRYFYSPQDRTGFGCE
jgi:hypothetical protein